MYRGVKARAYCSCSSIFIYFLPILHVNIIICVTVFLGILKFGMPMNNEMLYCCLEKTQRHCIYSFLYLSIFLSFQVSFVTVFSGTLQPESLNLVYAWRMSDCIKGLVVWLIAHILPFLIYFPFSLHFTFIVSTCHSLFKKY